MYSIFQSLIKVAFITALSSVNFKKFKGPNGKSNLKKFKEWYKTQNLKLGVIGMQGSGKSLFLSKLSDSNYIEKQTSLEEYDKFKSKINGLNLIIQKGTDISGGDSSVKYHYPKIINNKDLILFFFDISKYIGDFDIHKDRYFRDCNSRIDFIVDVMMKEDIKTKVFIVGTHIDKLKKTDKSLKKELLDKLKAKKINKKSYYHILKDVELINTTKKRECERLLYNTFKKLSND